MILAGIAAASPSPVGVPGAGIFTSPLILSLTIWVPVAVAISMHYRDFEHLEKPRRFRFGYPADKKTNV